jgi:hypothetical protein
MSSKATNQPLKQLTAMTQANPKFGMGKMMLTVDELHKVGNLVSTFITTTSKITNQVKR